MRQRPFPLRRLLRLLLLLIATCVASSSCAVVVKDQAYRSSSAQCGTPGQLPCSVVTEQLRYREFNAAGVDKVDKDMLTRSWAYRLAFIEFNDSGELHDRGELPRVLAAIERTKADARALGRPPVVALFVHGWKNNASEHSGNVWGFRQTLAGLASQYSRPTDLTNGSVPVLGIYVGWHGDVLNLPIVEQFTFWDRYAKSGSLATSATSPMVDALVQIMKAAKPAPQPPAAADPLEPISILIGHSFGGAVLETAVSFHVQELIKQVTPGSPLRAPADMIMFLNEAQEARRSRPLLDSMTMSLPPQDHCQDMLAAPLILSISSTGDSATRAFFPFGQFISRPFRRLNGSSRSEYYHTTAHLAELQSHVIITTKKDEHERPLIAEADKPILDACLHPLSADLSNLSGVPAEYTVVERPNSRNRTPYWVMQMPPSIVPDHSTIFTPVFRNFLITLVMQTRAVPD
jgi:hypothetical protein